MFEGDNRHANVEFFRSKYRHLLFPNTPVEFETHEDRYHFYVEGRWDSWEKTLVGAKRRIFELIRVHSMFWDWSTPVIRLNPDWPGWQKINLEKLNELVQKYGGYSELDKHS